MKPQPEQSEPVDSAVHKARPLLDNLGEVATQLQGASHIFLFLDFDGTLAPIVDDPADAFMPAKTALSLIRLAEKPYVSIAIISGRALEDLEDRIGLTGLTYAGDHGFAIRGQGLNFVERIAAERRRALRQLSAKLEEALRVIPGARLEEKGFTASVHYRQVAEEYHEQLLNIVRDTVDSAGDLFRISQGLCVQEIRPRVEWNKGNATRWIMNLSGHSDALPLYIGDDTTDEDAFAALPNGITIKVGPDTQTLAKYRLESQGMVADFLTWLVHLDRPQAMHGGNPE
jgi:trehalose-phosphatase